MGTGGSVLINYKSMLEKKIKYSNIKKPLLFVILFLGIFFLGMFLVEFLQSVTVPNDLQSERIRLTKTDFNSIPELIVVIMIVPIIEELMYRYGLKFSPNKTSFLVIGIVYTIYIYFQPKDINWNNPLSLLFFFGGFITLFFISKFFLKANKEMVENFYINNSKLIFIISLVAFAYSHFTLHANYHEIKNILLSPIILSSYLIAGFLYGTIRLRLGFIWGILAHMLWNLLVVYLY